MVVSTKESGFRTRNREKESWSTAIRTCTKGIGLRDKELDKGPTTIQTVTPIAGNGKTTQRTAMAS